MSTKTFSVMAKELTSTLGIFYYVLVKGMNRIVMRRSILRSTFLVGIAILGLSMPANAAQVYYVRAGASGSNNGSDWNNAYTSLPSSMNRGATYYIADGSYSNNTFNTSASGTTLITVRKATQADHGTNTGWSSGYGDGQAIFSGSLQFTSPYWLFDGQSWAGFKLNCTSTPGSADSGGSVYISANNVTIKYLHLYGTYSAGDGHSLVTTGQNTELYYCWFQGSAFEDHIAINGVSGGTFVIDHCRFSHSGHPNDGIHRDLMNPWSGVSGFNLTFTNNIVSGSMLDCLLLQNGYSGGGKLGVVTIIGNIFSGGQRAYGFGSTSKGCTTLYDENNIYYNIEDNINSGSTWGSKVTRNNVYGTGADANAASGAQYSAWMSGASGYTSGTGNINNASPKFINANSVDGQDGIPFTADDGFNIQSGSDLIGAGSSCTPSRTADILGNAISQNPSIGPYEYGTGKSQSSDPVAPDTPNNLRIVSNP